MQGESCSALALLLDYKTPAPRKTRLRAYPMAYAMGMASMAANQGMKPIWARNKALTTKLAIKAKIKSAIVRTPVAAYVFQQV